MVGVEQGRVPAPYETLATPVYILIPYDFSIHDRKLESPNSLLNQGIALCRCSRLVLRRPHR